MISFFTDGSRAPTATSVLCLGALIVQKGDQEMKCPKLETLSMQDSVFVANFPVILLVASKLMQGTCTVCLTCKQLRLPGPFHTQCLRSTACVRSTWGAALRGVDRISNKQRSEAIV